MFLEGTQPLTGGRCHGIGVFNLDAYAAPRNTDWHHNGRILAFAIGLAISCVFVSTTASADACSDQFQKERGPDWFKYVIGEFWKKPPEIEPNTPTYHFTTRSGFALGYKCDPKSNKRYPRLIYYPVGLVVQQLDKHSIKTKGVFYTRLRAIYGLQMFIPNRSLEPFSTKVKGYLFVDGPNNVPYCARKTCPDPSLNDTKLLLTAGGENSGIGRYGIVAEVNKIGQCEEFKFYPQESGKKITKQSTYLNTCWKGFKEKTLKIKYITLDEITKRFQHAKRGGSYSAFSKGLLSELKLPFSSLKNCQELDTYATEGKFKIGGNYYIFSTELSTKVQKKITRPQDYHHYFSHYYLDKEAFGIESSSQCLGGDPVPSKAKYIQVYHKDFDISVFAISIKDVVKSYDEKFKMDGFKATNGTHLMKGKYFTVCDSSQYFYFRDLFRDYMDDLEETIEFLAQRGGDKNEMEFLKDYFAHVIMASSVRLKRKCKS